MLALKGRSRKWLALMTLMTTSILLHARFAICEIRTVSTGVHRPVANHDEGSKTARNRVESQCQIEICCVPWTESSIDTSKIHTTSMC
jgi:hypothetical protein